ncbi:hypothetical protein CHS0354_013346 [Potamilus streckersoni]|uniref:PX domain-containing protein n=1 Tax=Potamilus streckersoni TaxID=2493646 RepID=A0AAE0T200_9BIVA|nr:hypothetical protein CHS0354_013346 [Potamilus streckersoni]
MIRVSVPSYRKVEEGNDSYTVFKIDVFHSGRFHSIERRYSEFEDLHKQLKKMITAAEFPPKKVLKWSPKVLEQRRQGLQLYLQKTLEGDMIPTSFFKFLEVSISKSGSFESLDQVDAHPTIGHQPMVGFSKDAFLQENYRSILPDIIVEGVHQGIYSHIEEPIYR